MRNDAEGEAWARGTSDVMSALKRADATKMRSRRRFSGLRLDDRMSATGRQMNIATMGSAENEESGTTRWDASCAVLAWLLRNPFGKMP